MAVELLGPSRRPEEQTPPRSATGVPIPVHVVDTTAADVALIPVSAENPAPAEAVTMANGTPLPVYSVGKPSAERADTIYGHLPNQNFFILPIVLSHINIGKRDIPYFRNSDGRRYVKKHLYIYIYVYHIISC